MYYGTNIVVIIQARMGSTRLPGKVMQDIVGEPMLWHVINRIKKSKFKKDIVIATTRCSEDDIIEQFCVRENINCYRGSEYDVLDRYYKAARKYNASIVVRITSDCPLIDPLITDRVISAYMDNIRNYDFASNVIKRTYPRGLDTEVMSFLTLEKTWKLAKEYRDREHVTLYIHHNPEEFNILSVENDKDLSYLRWTVDEDLDLLFVKEIYKRLYFSKKVFYTKDILQILEQEHSLIEINKTIRQKDI
jgi:spore coat polysaccharide biosynthesis protein SpsF